MKKKCSHCGEIKHTSEFSKNKSQKDGLRNYCKSCQKETRRKDRNKFSTFAVNYKGNECVDCGKHLTYENNKGEYDFHHTDPFDKTSTIRDLLGNHVSSERLINELDKCVLLCKPCHRKRHSDYKRGLRETL